MKLSGLVTPIAKELVMSQHNYSQEPTIQNTLTLSVSETKQKSLHKQVEIIGYSLDSFLTYSNINTRAILKADALKLVRMLDEIERMKALGVSAVDIRESVIDTLKAD